MAPGASQGTIRRRHEEATVVVATSAKDLFDRLDDQTRLGKHMERPSAMMGGGQMTYRFDEGRGMAVGSHIIMGGSAFGIRLYVDEVITEREPPHRKVWKTVGTPRMLIIGAYEMGFEIAPEGEASRLRVWIDYDLPKAGLWRLFGLLLAPAYGRWCVERMTKDAVGAFPRPSGAQVAVKIHVPQAR